MSKNKTLSMPQIQELAQRLVAVEFGDHGTFGGNVAENLTDLLFSLDDSERLYFTELFLAEMRLNLLAPHFGDTNTRFQTTSHHFNPRLGEVGGEKERED